ERGVAVMATYVAQVEAIDGVHRLAGGAIGTFSPVENGIASMSPPYTSTSINQSIEIEHGLSIYFVTVKLRALEDEEKLALQRQFIPHQPP
ncbi:hypothetical protein Tco_0587627, partial [Tanacetum coccineum]